MAKNPFERILSLVERKKLLSKKINGKQPFFCKFDDGEIGQFVPLELRQDLTVEGILHTFQPSNAKSRNVTAMFKIDRQTYFVSTRLLKNGFRWVLTNSPEFYLLNRRESFRIDLPPNYGVTMTVYHHNELSCQVISRLIDFSAGGARIRWVGPPFLRARDILRGTLQWFKNREIPISCEVRHGSSESGTYGIMFLEMDAVQSNRLKLMSIELQQMVHFT